MDNKYPSYNLNWLSKGEADTQIVPASGDIELLDMNVPEDLGVASMCHLKLPLGVSLFHGVHKFKPKAFGMLIPLTKFEGTFNEVNLHVQLAYGGQFCHHENHPSKSVIFCPGNTLFRYAKKVSVTSYLDASHDSEMIGFSIPRSALDLLLGQEESQSLINSLGLCRNPSLEIHKTSQQTASILSDAVTSPLVGQARKLFIQGKLLEFFSSLSIWLHSAKSIQNDKTSLAKRIEEFLLAIDGRISTLDEVSMQFGMPARHLNQVFQKEFGVSIASFLSAHRLEQAKLLLEQKDVPMKVVAANLGYSHVNHFITAFKRRFGVTPGKARMIR